MKRKKLITHYIWLICLFLFFVGVGIFAQPINELGEGLLKIFTTSSVLITDYLAIGGMGATFFNAGLLGLLCTAMLIKMDMKPNGSILLSLFLVFSFAFFGKNLLNVWPVILGVYAYSIKKNQPFKSYTIIALLSTSLAPATNQIYVIVTHFLGNESIFIILFAILLAIIVGVILGFILPPLVVHCMKIHDGFVLSNIGFACGFISITFVSIIHALGIKVNSRYVLSSEYTTELSVILFILFGSLILIGLFYSKEPFSEFLDLNKESGRVVTDFFILYGENLTFINVGLIGILYTVLTLVLTGEMNGAFIAGIFTVAGFAATGLNLKNVLPVTTGAILAAALNLATFDVNFFDTNTLTLTILLGTSLAPFSGHFGVPWGILAGFLHLCLTLNIGIINAGVNLYNNGFVAGIIAVVLVPIASSLEELNE